MKKKGIKWIKMNPDTKTEVVETVEEKEETKMNFFTKHKKGLIIGGLGALAAGAAGIFLASKKGSDDDEYEDIDDEDFVDDEIAEELEKEEA